MNEDVLAYVDHWASVRWGALDNFPPCENGARVRAEVKVLSITGSMGQLRRFRRQASPGCFIKEDKMGKFRPTPDADYGRIARHAADIMDERGWTQGIEMSPVTGAVCLLGAARLAVSPMSRAMQDTIICKLSDKFGEWMVQHYSGTETVALSLSIFPSMPAWNDTVFSSKEETVSWLRKFADDMDPQNV